MPPCSTCGTGGLLRALTILCFIAMLSLVTLGAPDLFAATVKQRTFASADEAVDALINALKTENKKELAGLLGPWGKGILSSGDPVRDRADHQEFLRLHAEKSRLEESGPGRMTLYVGSEDWPFPVPVVMTGKAWRFDGKEGKKEILARRIGKNELSAIQTLLAFVDAQREYGQKDWDGDGYLEYASRFASEPGKKNGLYWETKEGEAQSPLGPLAAAAQREGYSRKKSSSRPVPYHGYFFRILTSQGKDAPGGAYDYIANGHLIGGFAFVAYPATYGNSGIMTFIVNHDGVVYQKNLGKGTMKAAQELKSFNPNKTWSKANVKP